MCSGPSNSLAVCKSTSCASHMLMGLRIFEHQPTENQWTNPSQAPVSMGSLRIEASIAVKVSMTQAKVHQSTKLTHRAFEMLCKGEGRRLTRDKDTVTDHQDVLICQFYMVAIMFDRANDFTATSEHKYNMQVHVT